MNARRRSIPIGVARGCATSMRFAPRGVDMTELLEQTPPAIRPHRRTFDHQSFNERTFVPARELAQPRHCHAGSALLFAATLLLSSTLLFLVQPMFARMFLPRLGGTAAVWNTCMVFFQACLLGGYAYAHLLTRHLRPSRQLIVHAFVMALPAIVLPLALPAGSTPPADANPIPWLLVLLTLSVGLPFFVVSTTAPLIQRWFALTTHRNAGDPYFLYAASNAGSMTALLAYPTLVEPWMSLAAQTTFWTWGYVVFALLTFACGLRAAIKPANDSSSASAAHSTTALVPWSKRLRWIALALVPSSYLLGVTTYLTTDVAAVPLLWVLPLALYLLTFVLAFARRPIVSHRLMIYALPTAVLAPALFMLVHAALPIWAGVGLHLFAFFIASMVCHGELARSRPDARHLTDFYLMISVGGVLGGAFNALLAPLLFTRAIEYPLAIVAAVALCPARDSLKSLKRSSDLILALAVGPLAWLILAAIDATDAGITLKIAALILPLMICVRLAGTRAFAVAVAALLLVATFSSTNNQHVLEARRSFFGIHRIVRSADSRFNELFHGTTVHGRQRIDANGAPIQSDEPLTYYHRSGPAGQIIASIPDHKRRNVGVIGLGVGSLAAYANANDHYTFFEIDPLVRWAALDSGRFSYLKDARDRDGKVDVVLGDARLTLASVAPRSFDVLVLDAFSGDAIPLHLLTRESVAMYLDKLTDDGVLLCHVSNLYLDLEPVLANLAADARCIALVNNDLDLTEAEQREGKTASQWIVIARSRSHAAQVTSPNRWRDARPIPSNRVWTDDYSNILTTLR